MSKILSNRKLMDIVAGGAIFLCMLALIVFPSESVQAAKDGLLLCYNVILPSLFPFFVLSSLIVDFGLARHLGLLLERIMRPLFNVNGSCSAAFTLGFIGGYPVGAKTAINLYEKGMCTKIEAERLLSFCNNSGPAFILGVVGAGIFSSSGIGVTLYLGHVLASVIVGIIFRFYKSGGKRPQHNVPPRFETVRFSTAFTNAVKGSFLSTLNICAFVTFFTVLIRMLFLTGIVSGAASLLTLLLAPLGMGTEIAKNLLTGFIEISSGVWTLKDASQALPARMSMAAFMLGWAGVSVHCQVLSFIGKSGLSVRTYLLGKFMHGVISAAFIYIIAGLFAFEAPVSTYLAEQVTGIAKLDFATALSVSFALSVGVWICLTLLVSLIMSKKSGKKRKSIV